MRQVILGLGANLPSRLGAPAATLAWALRELDLAGLAVERVSRLYASRALGLPGQPDYRNAVVAVRTDRPVLDLLRTLKGIERRAGRRLGSRWGARVLDLDILADSPRLLGWDRPVRRPVPRRRQTASLPLTIPHRQLHRRAFVLVPLADVVPAWRHPVLGRTLRQLRASVPPWPATRPALEEWSNV